MEKSRSKNVNNSRVTHSVDPAVIEENAKKAPDGDALYREAFAKKLNELLEEKQIDQKDSLQKPKFLKQTFLITEMQQQLLNFQLSQKLRVNSVSLSTIYLAIQISNL